MNQTNPRIGEHLARTLEVIADDTPVSDEERAVHAQAVHLQMWRDRNPRRQDLINGGEHEGSN